MAARRRRRSGRSSTWRSPTRRPGTPVAADEPDAITIARHRRRRRRRPGARRRGRDVADGGPFTRCATGPDGALGGAHRQARPPCRRCDGTPQAPHLVVSVFARGLLDRVVTRIYFGDEAAANAADPTLAVVEPGRAPSLVAEPTAPAGTASTSASKVTMSPSSSPSDRSVRVPRRPRPGGRGDVGAGVGPGDARRRGRAGRRPGRRRRHPAPARPRRSPRPATSSGSTSTRSLDEAAARRQPRHPAAAPAARRSSAPAAAGSSTAAPRARTSSTPRPRSSSSAAPSSSATSC